MHIKNLILVMVKKIEISIYADMFTIVVTREMSHLSAYNNYKKQQLWSVEHLHLSALEAAYCCL